MYYRLESTTEGRLVWLRYRPFRSLQKKQKILLSLRGACIEPSSSCRQNTNGIRYGKDDELGTLNRLTKEVVVEAAKEIKTGERYVASIFGIRNENNKFSIDPEWNVVMTFRSQPL